MSQNRDILKNNEQMFAKIARKVLEKDGFSPFEPMKNLFQSSLPDLVMKKGGNTYCVEFKSSRREIYNSRNILSAAQNLITLSKSQDWLPLFVIGGVMTPSLKADLLGLSIRTIVIDIQNLLYMAQCDRELYDELVAYLPYSVADLIPAEPDYLPMPDWNAAYGGGQDWKDNTLAPAPDCSRPVTVPEDAVPGLNVDAMINIKEYLDDWDSGEAALQGSDAQESDETGDVSTAEDDLKQCPKAAGVTTGDYLMDATGRSQVSSEIDVGGVLTDVNGNVLVGDWVPGIHIFGRPGTGKSALTAMFAFQLLQKECSDLRKDIESWQGGKQTNSTAYEKLCTRTLMRLFADDLTLWNEQAKSNADLYRFDLICKIKRDNHKDFWEVAERYFDSKYIIFEFKNYSGKVTQKEVYTTVRYLYPTALRRVAIIISPNGIDDHADKAIRGVLRDEGKLILSLTNAELIHMLQMKEDGEDPADYLSDKLDALLIDLEK